MSGKIKPENMPIKKYTSKEALPMVIKLQINNFSVLRVSVNPTSRADILYWSAFLKMRLSESMLKPCQANLMGFLGEGVPVKGYIDLDTTFGNGGNTKMINVRYLVVDSESAYNVVIGRPALKDLKAVISVADLSMEYPVGDGKKMSGKIKPENMPIKKYTSEEALPMVIKLQINNFSVLRVSVNPCSQADILYWSAFLKMGLSESMLKPCEAYLKGIFGEGVPVKGYIDLDTTFGKGGNAKMIKVRYLVVDSWSVYNVVIGWPALKNLKAVISVADLTMEYPVGDGKVRVVEAHLEMAKKCHEMAPYTI